MFKSQEQNLIQIVRSVVNNSNVPECEDLERIIAFSRYHLVQNIVAEALVKNDDISEKLPKSLTEEQTLLLIKDANQEAEANELAKIFETEKIPVVLLKGWYLKKFYPRSDLRVMADIDMFINKADEKKVHTILKNRDYCVTAFGGKKDNVYKKEPFIILEIHKNLFMFEDNWNKYLNDENSEMYIWKRVVNVGDYEYVYRMDDELFYVYMIAHIAKHLLDDGGIGLKSIIDVWLFLKKNRELNFDIINRDLGKLELIDFSNNVVMLSEYWFGDNDNVTQTVKQLGEHILDCGVYGNSAVMVATKDDIMMGDNPGSTKYLLKRAFPSYDAMKIRYPKLENKKWLLPIYYIKRLWYSLVYRRKEVKSEYVSSKKIDYDKVKSINQLYKEIGLK